MLIPSPGATAPRSDSLFGRSRLHHSPLLPDRVLLARAGASAQRVRGTPFSRRVHLGSTCALSYVSTSDHMINRTPRSSYAAVTTRLRSTAQGDHSDNPFRFMVTLFDVSLNIAMPQMTFNANEATSGVSDAHTATGQASATDDMRSNSTSATNDTLSN